MPTDAERIAELERQMAVVLARLDVAGGGQTERNAPAVPLKVAAFEMGITEEAALKRAQRASRRGHPGVQRFDRRWYVSRTFVDDVKAVRRMSG